MMTMMKLLVMLMVFMVSKSCIVKVRNNELLSIKRLVLKAKIDSYAASLSFRAFVSSSSLISDIDGGMNFFRFCNIAVKKKKERKEFIIDLSLFV